MKRGWPLVMLALAGCGREPAAQQATGAGARLERAAIAEGLVVDPASASLDGSWSRDTDRACIVPGEGGDRRIGVLVDYGEGQGCAASGTVRWTGERLSIRFGNRCRIEAAFDGSRISFPAEVPAACESLCVGRASLAALSVDRLSESVSEARNLRTPGGRSLCPDS